MDEKKYMAVEDLIYTKGYISEKTYIEFRDRYKECIRMLNGLEKTLEKKLPAKDRRWEISEAYADYGSNADASTTGWLIHEQ